MGNAKRDDNYVTSLIAVSNVDGSTPVTLYADPTTHRLLVSATPGTLDDLTDVTITAATQGDVFYYNGVAWVNLPAGTAGQFLETRGNASNPRWGTPTAGAGGSNTQLQYNNAGTLAGITGATSNGTIVTLNSAALGSPVITGTPTAAGSTWPDLGIVTTIDINGGTLDGVVIGASSAASAKVTTLTATTGINPNANDGFALGKSGTAFSDIFLASGAVIDFAVGNATITHASGQLTASANLIVTGSASISNNLQVTGSANISGNLGVTGSANISGNLKVTGTTTIATSLTGVLRADSGVVSVDSDVTDLVASANVSTAGIVRMATVAEVNTGTASPVIVANTLAHSNYGKRIIEVILTADSTANAVATQVASAHITIPTELNGWNLVSANASVGSPGIGSNQQIQIYNKTSGQNMLSTQIFIGSGDATSFTAATPSVVGTPALATGDRLWVNMTAVHTTPAKGLTVILVAQLP